MAEETQTRKEQKELRRLTRPELLELLVDMGEELEKVRAERDALKSELDKKEIRLKEAGNIAEAALSLSGIFEAAQEAADIYLKNVQAMSEE